MEHFDRIVTDPGPGGRRPRGVSRRRRAWRLVPRRISCLRDLGCDGGSRPGFVFTHEEFAHWIAVGLAALGRAGVTPETRLIAIGAPSDVHITRQLFGAFQAGRRGSAPSQRDHTDREDGRSAERLSTGGAPSPTPVSSARSPTSSSRAACTIQPGLISTTSEVLTDETEKRIEAAWGQPPVNAYAATEAPGIESARTTTSACTSSKASVVLEVVDEVGETPSHPVCRAAKVLLTSLVNRAQPLIRYELTDAIVLAKGPDPSGRPYLRIARVDGRSGDILRFRRADGGEVELWPIRSRLPFSATLDVRQTQSSASRTVCGCGSFPGRPRRPICPIVSATAIAHQLGGSRCGAERGSSVEHVDELERDPGHAAKLKLVIWSA